MRLLLAVAILMGGMIAASPSVDAGHRYARGMRLPCHAVPRPRVWRVAPPCRAWRYRPSYRPSDPTGEFRGFPGWARDAFTVLRN
jgi:hypothetical protein